MNLHRFSLLVIILCFAFSDDVKSDQSGNTVAHISPAKLVKLVIQRKQPTSDPDLKKDQPCFVFASHGPEKSVELESYSPQSPKYAFMLVPAGTVIVSGAGASVPVIGQVVGAAIGTALAISWLVDFIKHKKPSMKDIQQDLLDKQPVIVSAGGAPDPDDEEKNFFEKLVKNAARKALHKGKFGKFYKDPTTGFWWSSDVGGTRAHSGPHYKVFTEGAKGLDWFYDADLLGNKIIGKNKGPIGLHIPYKELIFLS